MQVQPAIKEGREHKAKDEATQQISTQVESDDSIKADGEFAPVKNAKPLEQNLDSAQAEKS